MTLAAPLTDLWTLDPTFSFLNHGSFGACPRPVLAEQARLRAQMESQPVRFMVRELEPLLDASRAKLASWLGGRPEDLVFVPNATTGVATVLATLDLQAGDEILTTSHVYAAVRNALVRSVERTGARVVTAAVPFPLARAEQVTEAILAAVTPRTRLAVIDHVTSPTALVYPILQIVAALKERGVETFVDGAHAPGQVPVALDAMRAAYYTGNCHKWPCAPKGSGFIHIRRDLHDSFVPLIPSHGASSRRTDRSRLHLEFDWTGTEDFSAVIAVGAAIALVDGLGGWPAWQADNHALALAGRQAILDALDLPAPCPPEMVGAMASIPLPPDPHAVPQQPFFHYELAEKLFQAHRIEIPIFGWPSWPSRLLRLSAQRYNRLEEYQTLARVLAAELAAEPPLPSR